MSIGARIKQRRKELNLSVDELAKKLGKNRATVYRYESNYIYNLPITVLEPLAAALECSPAYIMGWDETTADEITELTNRYDNILPITTQRLPMLGEIACGQPIFANEDRESYVVVGIDIKADFCLKAKGDSMVNARIHDGDIIFIKKQSSVDNGEIAAVIIDNEATLKRVFFQPDKKQLMLLAENTAFAPLVFTGEELDHIRILGKAVAFQADVK